MNRRVSLLIVLLVAAVIAACVGLPLASAPDSPPERPAGAALIRPPTPQPRMEATPIPAEALSALSTAEQLRLVEIPRRDPRRLTERLNPELGTVPVTAEPKTYAMGDREHFWVHNADSKSNIEIEADLVYQTAVANVWVQRDQPHDLGRIQRSIDRFSDVTYPRLVETFGSEWSPGVDGDPRLNILHTTEMGNNVAGYFYSADEYSTVVNPFSNEKEIFFINLDFLNSMRDYTVYETVLAHEFQHMIHWNQDRGEELWLNEGLSEYAQEVAEYAPDIMFAYSFLADPDLSLTTWSAEPGANGPHYGASYLFVAYLAQRFGTDFLSRLVAEQSNGTVGVDHALQSMGSDLTYDDLFADWVVANWTDDPDALDGDGRYGYDALDLREIDPTIEHRQLPVATTNATVFPYATDYILLDGDGGATFNFTGAPTTRLAGTTAPDGVRMWWSNRGDDSNMRLTRQFDLSTIATGTPVTLTLDAWWNIEETYDYGYVMASADGEHWQILAGQRTRTDDPTGNSLGAGYTGVSGDGETPAWVNEVYDLGEFAGGPLWLQLNYVTDDAVNTEGWFVDNVAIPAIGYADSFEGDAGGWQSEGWVLTDNTLPQRWLVQVLTFDGDELQAVERVPVAEDGTASIAIDDLSGRRSAVVAISALVPATTEAAAYTYSVEASR